MAGLASAEITYENGVTRAVDGKRSALGTRRTDNQPSDWQHADEQRRDWRHDRRPEQHKPRPHDIAPRDRQARPLADREFRNGYRDGYDNGYGDGRRDNRGSRYPQNGYLEPPGYAYPAPGYGGSRRPGYGYDAPRVEPRYELRGGQNGILITPGYPRNIDNNPTYRRSYPTDR